MTSINNRSFLEHGRMPAGQRKSGAVLFRHHLEKGWQWWNPVYDYWCAHLSIAPGPNPRYGDPTTSWDDTWAEPELEFES